jgi:FMN reductase
VKERTLAVVSAGLSQPSSTRLLADQLAAATERELERRGVRVVTEVVELRQYAHDVVNTMLTGFPPAGLKKVFDLVARADGLIAVSPIFNASYSGLFKSFFDTLDDAALVDTPVLVAATGGTARHSLALEHAMRPMFAYLRAVVVPTGVFAAAEDWGDGSARSRLSQRVDRAAGELAAQMELREPAEVIDPFDNPTPFEQLLAEGES